jgi:transposase
MCTTYLTQDLHHLGIVAGVCEKINLIGQIDARITDTGRKVSVGQAVQAMVLNGLGFSGRATYLTPEFYASKPVDLLIGEGLEAGDLNSDSLGKALDCLHEAGITELFAAVSVHALREYGIDVRFAHLDTTAFSLQGEYDVAQNDVHNDAQSDAQNDETDAEQVKAHVINVTYGHSKDHRPDLKQAILGMICANRTSIPLYLGAISGNTSDKTSLPEIASVYLEQLSEEDETPILVADSALYTANTIAQRSENQWVSRVPATINEAKDLLANTDQEAMSTSQREGYFFYETTSVYGGVAQRWLLVLYEPRRKAALAGLEKRLQRERTKLANATKKLQRHVFNCPQDAQKALQRFNETYQFHTIMGEVTSSRRYAQPGRPTDTSATVTDWQLRLTITRDDEAIAQAQKPLGKYIIATNVCDEQTLPTEELLTLYKDQNCSVERGFRFLKDPMFFAHSLFLKKPSRIMALLMVMGLSLLIYALAEHHLRQQLVAKDQTIPDQKGKPTQQPTMRRVFQMFEGIHVLIIHTDTFRQRLVTNVKEVHLQIAALLGEPILKFYTFDEMTL